MGTGPWIVWAAGKAAGWRAWRRSRGPARGCWEDGAVGLARSCHQGRIPLHGLSLPSAQTRGGGPTSAGHRWRADPPGSRLARGPWMDSDPSSVWGSRNRWSQVGVGTWASVRQRPGSPSSPAWKGGSERSWEPLVPPRPPEMVQGQNRAWKHPRTPSASWRLCRHWVALSSGCGWLAGRVHLPSMTSGWGGRGEDFRGAPARDPQGLAATSTGGWGPWPSWFPV